ncbi:glycosyltransferase [Pseudoduganella umbonata]|uniref:Glycosyltransferase family 1 protein n=1 Tax=Pseudoduganella umbonata TaxID=864828 RepID=A0A4V1ED78_9BURK|nr:nucleotide disphospho-sugar-binding domain-containing protein [Pseudoduganella umbonata]MBB3220141.1 UDP:flavonoid glycosyltransferase YjiC (YdhE family) [Pseudoduganella umbonata]QCP10131.1 glycosyltransferase family 1 protein [Pseudoduganella umbonata]
MAHIHLAWEIGGGLGHAARLKTLARVLLARGHRVSLSLRDLGYTQRVMADLPVPRFQAPVWLHRTEGMPPNHASLAEILLAAGYLEVPGLAGLAEGWRTLFTLLEPDLVVADYAPTALLAARTLKVPTASVGVGFYSPPADVALPCLRDWEGVAQQRLARAEAHLLNVVNAVLEMHGAPELLHAARLLLGDAPLLCTWPEFDHYGRPAGGGEWLGPVTMPAGGAAPAWPPGTGPRVFAYLKHDYAGHAAVLQALVEEGCRVLCYLPEVAAGRAAPLRSPSIAYSAQPVAMEAALAGAALCVCHGGEAAVVQSSLAGVPVLMLPMQLEQYLMARRVESWGGGINGARVKPDGDWRAVVRLLLDDNRFRTAAAAFAHRRGDRTALERAERVADAFERQVAARR